jgi:hypothetical protein
MSTAKPRLLLVMSNVLTLLILALKVAFLKKAQPIPVSVITWANPLAKTALLPIPPWVKLVTL